MPCALCPVGNFEIVGNMVIHHDIQPSSGTFDSECPRVLRLYAMHSLCHLSPHPFT